MVKLIKRENDPKKIISVMAVTVCDFMAVRTDFTEEEKGRILYGAFLNFIRSRVDRAIMIEPDVIAGMNRFNKLAGFEWEVKQK